MIDRLRRIGSASSFTSTTLTSCTRRIAGLFEQGLRLCRKAGLVQLGRVAIDGTKLKANASKHKAMSYGRMQEKEAALHQ